MAGTRHRSVQTAAPVWLSAHKWTRPKKCIFSPLPPGCPNPQLPLRIPPSETPTFVLKCRRGEAGARPRPQHGLPSTCQSYWQQKQNRNGVSPRSGGSDSSQGSVLRNIWVQVAMRRRPFHCDSSTHTRELPCMALPAGRPGVEGRHCPPMPELAVPGIAPTQAKSLRLLSFKTKIT